MNIKQIEGHISLAFEVEGLYSFHGIIFKIFKTYFIFKGRFEVLLKLAFAHDYKLETVILKYKIEKKHFTY